MPCPYCGRQILKLGVSPGTNVTFYLCNHPHPEHAKRMCGSSVGVTT